MRGDYYCQPRLNHICRQSALQYHMYHLHHLYLGCILFFLFPCVSPANQTNMNVNELEMALEEMGVASLAANFANQKVASRPLHTLN